MEKAVTFIRGQVYIWSDPTFGAKNEGKNVPVGEATVRYNRYVVVAQTNPSGSNHIMVIPCSTKTHSPHDVPVSISHLYVDKGGYAKVTHMFPAHGRMLRTYICTLPEEQMQRIEAKLLTLLMPSIMSRMNAKGILKTFHLDIDEEYEPYEVSPLIIRKHIQGFIREYLYKTDNQHDTVKLHVMLSAFNQYLDDNNILLQYDSMDFLETFFQITNNYGLSVSFGNRYSLNYWKGLKLQKPIRDIIPTAPKEVSPPPPMPPNPVPIEQPPEPELVQPDKVKIIWTDEKKREFLEVYQNGGAGAVATKFGIKRTTAYNYYLSWRKDLLQRPSEWLDDKNDPPIPNTRYVLDNIIEISKRIRKRIMSEMWFDELSLHRNDNSVKIFPKEWYDQLGNAINFSLRSFLNVSNPGGMDLRTININTPHLQTLQFLDVIFAEIRKNPNETKEELVDRFRRVYGEPAGIEPEWLSVLKKSITNNKKLNMSSKGADLICEKVGKIFCSKA